MSLKEGNNFFKATDFPVVRKPRTCFSLANSHFSNKEYWKAINMYRKAVQEGGASDLYWQNLVLALNKAGNHSEAHRELYKALSHRPESKILNSLLLYYNKNHIENWVGPKLSIIVPVYNSGQYLEQCLSSILNQTFGDFELIVVNDGSTDNSGAIIQCLYEQDPRIKVIVNHKPSGNPGTPRNQAIEEAKGAYIGFVDSDDWVDSGFFGALMKKALSNYSDIVFSGGFKNHLPTGIVEERKYTNNGFNDPKSERYKYHDSFMIWDKVYSSKLLKAALIQLGETKAAVDVPFIFKAYYYAQRIDFDNDLIAYHYRRESESSVTNLHRKNSNCDFEFSAYAAVQEWILENAVPTSYKRLVDIKMVSSFLYTLKIISKEHFSGLFARVKEQLRLVDEELVKEFCVRQNKWWLYKEFLEVRSKEEEEVLRFFEAKKDLERKKQLDRRLERKFYIPGKKNGIMFFPAWISNNPYQKLFYGAVAERFGVRVAGFAREALCKELLEREREKFEYIHLHWLHAFIDAERADGADQLLEHLSYAKSLGYGIIYTAHNIISHDTKFYKTELMLRKKIMEHVDIALAHGVMAKEKLITELGIPPQMIVIVPHGTYEGYYANTVSRADAREALGINSDSFVFLFFGNIRGYKGVEPLLKEYKKVAKGHLNTTLLIAGRVMDSNAADALEREAQSANIIFKPGFIEEDDVQYYFNAADVCVLPYRRIVTSGAAMLSITFSCPVIAPKDGILPEIIGDDVGMLFDDYGHMGECMSKMVESMTAFLYPGSSKEVYGPYKDRFSWYNVVAGLPL
ncbi:glycosyltransferase [Desulfurivibrio alkaliphilus]|uniref:Glycosyl transferase family 2 n=1 Tax=Desulfurivibrio alkaliphilus (strain DSM 19089 / UNIQEM U267 / AHT2) TaxID=589865 RepID=D6Z4P9_DESAT|nr:glycosyltransferase [Desulfurivibrio alkaliphilus]ADH86524.1 glycosyl transferase family 2 [Desulfurivibrio alkaliphilus AHT 2]